MHIDWGLVLGIISVAGMPLTLALTMPASTVGEFRLLRWCFIGFGVLCIGSLFLLEWSHDWGPIEMKLLTNVVVGAVVIAVVTVGLDWLGKKQQQVLPDGDRKTTTSQPASGLNISGNNNVVSFGNSASINAGSSTAPASAQVAPAVTEKMPANRTIRQLKAMFEGRTALQANALIGPFKSLWVETEGTIVLVNTNPAVLLKTTAHEADSVECSFSKKWENVLARYDVGEKIKIGGHIADTQNGAQIYLRDCEVL